MNTFLLIAAQVWVVVAGFLIATCFWFQNEIQDRWGKPAINTVIAVCVVWPALAFVLCVIWLSGGKLEDFKVEK